MSSDALIDDFVAESAELLEGLDSELLEVLQTGDTAPLHKIFRAVHTVKGTAGFLGLLNVKNFAHRVEDVLERLRSNQLQLTAEMQSELTHCIDLLSEQIPRAAVNPPTPVLSTDEEAAVARLTEAAGMAVVDDRSALRKLAAFVYGPIDQDLDGWVATLRKMLSSWHGGKGNATEDSAAEVGDWLANATQGQFILAGENISPLVHPCLELFHASRSANISDDIINRFLVSVDLLSKRFVDLGQPDGAQTLNAIAADCRVIHESPIDLDELLVSNFEDQFRALILPLLSVIVPATDLPEQQVTEKPDASAALGVAKADTVGKSAPTVRVREELLDKFIWHVGETYLALELYRDLQNRLAETNVPSGLLTEFTELNRGLTVAVGKLQQSAMDIRRVPVGSLFNKVPSMVRQLAPQLGKQVEVEIVGGDIRIDKSLLQELDGPMTHLVRNALDHGLDTPAEREERGRPPVGRLRLSCRAERESIFLEIEDDGRGIDSEKIRTKAINLGMISTLQASSMSEEEIYQLLCRPGFSTAEKISDISGRGVGLDVVSSAITKNRGKLSIQSQLGVGTKFVLTFPVHSTVLMIDGLLCSTGTRYAAFGVEFVGEVVRLTPEMLRSVGGAPMAIVRGQTYRIFSLSDAFDAIDGSMENADIGRGEHGVILRHLHHRILLRVDRLLGYRKLVLKGIDRTLLRCPLLAGVAQLGGSKLALVFDVPELLAFLESNVQRRK